jgi:hypothetical protein
MRRKTRTRLVNPLKVAWSRYDVRFQKEKPVGGVLG